MHPQVTSKQRRLHIRLGAQRALQWFVLPMNPLVSLKNIRVRKRPATHFTHVRSFSGVHDLVTFIYRFVDELLAADVALKDVLPVV